MGERPGTRLWAARRAVRIVRVALAVLAVLSMIVAARTSEDDLVVSDTAFVVMLVALGALLLGGFVWWPPAGGSPAVRRRAWARVVARWVWAAIAVAGYSVTGAAVLTDHGAAVAGGLLVLCASPLAYPVVVGLSGARTEAGMTVPELRAWARDQRARHKVPYSRREVLVSRDLARQHAPLTVRPSGQPLSGGPPPRRMRGWLRHGALSADAATVSVTDARGRTWRLPRGGEGGVADLAICRETVRYINVDGTGTEPLWREHLSLVTRGSVRLLDVEIYGWTRSELCRFAEATGLGLRRLWLDTPHVQQLGLFQVSMPPTPIGLMLPRGAGYRRVPGRARWPAVLGYTAGVLTALGAVAALWGAAAGVGRLLTPVAPGWLVNLAGMLVSVVLLALLAVGVRRTFVAVRTRYRERARTVDEA
ncbi:hypothetical protein [Marinitenerispora sediminis]|uniref:Uncharacterized protein n=1 Tax=Marinitenerispora sediminis TaxID=1931232 RepID=A0A368TBW2_9ACTN|nr:hypothetical protein [Marinitenerispora sediminis]RCV53515.1 hypothetical protein DEF28_10305 [Marinitenerispora sediminis]RCV57673.1 hypothetical protein DEF23_10190 [Marinitenerispora sediminis]RCV60772.1 hypothetical protein DEF24_06255 [Marinitenerispora sediminis]